MPLRLVPDTNVLISALLWDGRARAILDAARRGQCELYSSSSLIAELEEKLAHPKFAARINALDTSPASLLAEVRDAVTVIQPDAAVPVAVRDPDDLAVLEAASAARAEAVVTQDKDLLELRDVLDLAILNIDEPSGPSGFRAGSACPRAPRAGITTIRSHG